MRASTIQVKSISPHKKAKSRTNQDIVCIYLIFTNIHFCKNLKKNEMSILIDQRILELCDEFVPGDPPEYFFDKNPENFSAILELHRSLKMRSFYIVLTSTVAHIFFRNGFLHISENGCALVLQVSRNQRR